MRTVQIIKGENGGLATRTPFHPAFPARARKLGGRWDGKYWTFDARDESRVRELCREIYGTDGEDEAASDRVTVRVTVGGGGWNARRQGLYLCGREVARAFGRDSGAKLGEGVVVLEGGFTSGGSVKNWETQARPGTVFEMRDVPRRAVAAVGNGTDDGLTLEVIEEHIDRDVDKDALRAERERLLARVAEIDNLLK